jgi:hypothetical protein
VALVSPFSGAGPPVAAVSAHILAKLDEIEPTGTSIPGSALKIAGMAV